MPPKVDIFVGLQYRDKFSVGQNRTRLGRRAFHWSIIVAVADEFHRFDVTDGIVLSPVTSQDINPDRLWVYRHNVSDSLSDIPRYLGSVQINHRSVEVTVNELEKLFDKVPIPDNGGDRAEANCVSWTVEAIVALQHAGYCNKFDLEQFQDFAVGHADRRLADFKNMSDPTKYPPNTSRWLRLF